MSIFWRNVLVFLVSALILYYIIPAEIGLVGVRGDWPTRRWVRAGRYAIAFLLMTAILLLIIVLGEALGYIIQHL